MSLPSHRARGGSSRLLRRRRILWVISPREGRPAPVARLRGIAAAKLEQSLVKELASLPKAYGFDSLKAFIASLEVAGGGKRSFSNGGRSLTVKNYIHPTGKIKKIFNEAGFFLIREEERIVNEDVRPYYELKNALPVYERFKGMPVIYGLHLKKHRAA